MRRRGGAPRNKFCAANIAADLVKRSARNTIYVYFDDDDDDAADDDYDYESDPSDYNDDDDDEN